jgi:hypothetical protein
MNLFSTRQSVNKSLLSFGLLAALVLTPSTGNASTFVPNHVPNYGPANAAVAAQGSVVAATVTRVGHQALGITDAQLEQIRENLLKG